MAVGILLGRTVISRTARSNGIHSVPTQEAQGICRNKVSLSDREKNARTRKGRRLEYASRGNPDKAKIKFSKAV